MASYVALLRGVNVGGKNILPMRALVATFEALGLANVQTYIQSGNVLFDSTIGDPRKLERRIEAALAKAHACESKVVVRSRDEMLALERTLPPSWKRRAADRRYNVMFLRHTVDGKQVLDGLRPKPDIEEVHYRPGALLWSASVPAITRSAMIKVASLPIYQHMTVRNLNTTLKLCALLAARDVTDRTSRSRRPSAARRGS